MATLGLLCLFATVLLLRLIPVPKLYWPATDSKVLFDREGRLLTLSLSGDEKYRFFVPIEQISSAVIQSTLQYEDRYFFSHPGVNPYSLVRAAWTTIANGASRTVGGSTLTMQLVRLRMRLKKWEKRAS